MEEFEPVWVSENVDKVEDYKLGDLVPDSNFAVVAKIAYGLEPGKGNGRLTICQSRSRGNCLRCFRRFTCDAIDLRKS